MGFIPMVFTAVSTIASVVGGISQANAQAASYRNQEAAARANAQIAAMNANIENMNAETADAESRIEAAQRQADWNKQLGRQRAAMAQGGVLESATGMLVRAAAEQEADDDLAYMELSASNKRLGFLSRAADYQFQSGDYSRQANQARYNAGQARSGGLFGAIGSVAAGIGTGYGQYRTWMDE